MLKTWGNLGKNWDLTIVKSIIIFSTKLKKVEELIELVTRNETVKNIIRIIHFQDILLFIYDV